MASPRIIPVMCGDTTTVAECRCGDTTTVAECRCGDNGVAEERSCGQKIPANNPGRAQLRRGQNDDMGLQGLLRGCTIFGKQSLQKRI
ncbi:hypothetical protein E2562_036982 [Oryza meyeriana var. granulata]|uniref:Uncharacterized protein n=1 Tax=Oryza meyeriana var. granulata TaxID=110450 RepID=A0A6G1F1U6_9ORYZ|nr:hypothetical protein E2562_036982 [Oryza meyeriana var. granulata]